MHPRSRRWHLQDYVLVRRRNRQDVLVTKAIRDADGWTDHHLVISQMRLRMQPWRRPQVKRLSGKLNTLLFNLPAHCFDFSNQITEKLEDLQAPDDDATVKTRWRQLRNVIQSTTLEVIGCERRQHQDCLIVSAMLMDTYRDEQPEIRITYRTDRHLLNSRRMQASIRASTTTVHDLLFADDCTLNTVMEEDMQRTMDLFATVCAEYNAPRINVNNKAFVWDTVKCLLKIIVVDVNPTIFVQCASPLLCGELSTAISQLSLISQQTPHRNRLRSHLIGSTYPFESTTDVSTSVE
ncbi:unnamed protein product [Schistocephalus solidus]|uniref:Reverse transcriptase domain-containing protein n=1 Tax=Schistocephalus solidus TaxID=70667 RepID=A0A183T6J4_SCHSO|nr:unnamed protein product [Schistocephalus solidus]